MFEQRHFAKTGESFDDRMMFLKASIDIDSVAIVKLVKIDESKQTNASKTSSLSSINETEAVNGSDTTLLNLDEKKRNALTLLGVSNEGYLTFKYENQVQKFA